MILKTKEYGFFCVILGPDGSGKGTIINRLKLIHAGYYNIIESFHWRPGFLPPLKNIYKPWKWRETSNTPVTNPHGSRPSGYIFSFIRLFYYLFDFVIGFYFTTYRLLIRNALVIFDRYYYDIIVDPLRSRIKLPSWLIKLFLPLIPKPDVTIYLDASPETLYKRKPELPITELSRQINEFRELILNLPNPVIVSTEKSLDEVVYEVSSAILNKISEKIENEIIMHKGFLFNFNLAQGYVALPSKKKCRWIIPTNPNLAKKSWDLYLPYSFKGRIFKNVMKFLSARGLLSVLKAQKLTLDLVDESELLKKCIAEVFKRDDFVLAISTGTPGSFRKITAMIIDSNGKVLGYAKIGETPPAIERIKNEARILKQIVNSYWLSVISVPKCLYEGEVGNAYVMIQTPAPFEGKSGSSMFNEGYAEVLANLIKTSLITKKFLDSEFYKNLKYGIESYPLSYRNIFKEGMQYLEETIGEKEIYFSLSHGDFAPWNMLWNNREAFLFDWESASVETPAGIDLVHFLFQTGFLLRKLRGKKLFDFCINERHHKMLEDKLKVPIIDCRNLLLVYLLKMAIDEDKPQQLSKTAVERRRLIRLLVNRY